MIDKIEEEAKKELDDVTNDLKKEITSHTQKNRDILVDAMDTMKTKDLIRFTIDSIKYFQQQKFENITKGQYMLIMDAFEIVLKKRSVIDKNEKGWSLEEFFNNDKYHSVYDMEELWEKVE